MKQVKVYKIKKLIDGYKVRLIGQYVAVPDIGYKDFRIIVEYGRLKMTIPDWNKAVTFRNFHDRFGRKQNYLLGYFLFNPDEPPE